MKFALDPLWLDLENKRIISSVLSYPHVLLVICNDCMAIVILEEEAIILLD